VRSEQAFAQVVAPEGGALAGLRRSQPAYLTTGRYLAGRLPEWGIAA
jgi:hypothetical protein